ncbi:MAG: hypothetical protein K8T89_25545 [Planctomycetes bacterium]|nr:hypothetical protein [Planctomycetota bacterium]
MNPSINLLDRMLTRSRQMLDMGRRVEARRRLDKLLTFPDVPETIRIEAHRLLGEIHLDAQCFRRARRHLLAALGLAPNDAETHYQLGVALDLDPDIDPKRAAREFKKALELKPDEARYWSGYGQICLRLGREKQSFGAFAAAADLAPMDLEVVDEIIDGLCFLGREEDARSVLMSARFRFGHSEDLEQLWNRFRFLQLHRKQQASKRRLAMQQGEAVILPFVSSKESTVPKVEGEPGILRFDRGSRPLPHTLRQPDPKRAPQ